MPLFQKFKGINNVAASERLSDSELAVATDVDITATGELQRRKGFTITSALAHSNVWEAPAFVLATVGNDLVSILPGGTRTTLHPSLGTDRVWYTQFPDGRVAYSNGLLTGVVAASGLTRTSWGVPVPAGTGALTDVAGSLHPGSYQYQITYVRLADNLEGGPAYTNPANIAQGGMLITGLPQLAGHGINIYITGKGGGDAHLTGMTLTSSFSFTGPNSSLVLPCRTDYTQPMPAGKLCATWRGRALMALGNVLAASRVHQPESFDYRSDFKQFPDPITLIQPMDEGIFVGTTTRLYFLAGREFQGLTMEERLAGNVVLGSGVPAPAEMVRLGDDVGKGRAMMAIVGGLLVAGTSDGHVVVLSESRYKTTATEVAATFRKVGEIPQYMAVPL